MTILGRGLIGILELYRTMISPFVGPACRFHPSCSQYAIEAIEKHGPLAGMVRAAGRLLRCRPGCPAGFDPA